MVLGINWAYLSARIRAFARMPVVPEEFTFRYYFWTPSRAADLFSIKRALEERALDLLRLIKTYGGRKNGFDMALRANERHNLWLPLKYGAGARDLEKLFGKAQHARKEFGKACEIARCYYPDDLPESLCARIYLFVRIPRLREELRKGLELLDQYAKKE